MTDQAKALLPVTPECDLCGDRKVVQDGIGLRTYPETAPCPKCQDGTWAYRALLAGISPSLPGDVGMREALVKARRALSCYRCGGDGSVTTALGEPDECPVCHGEDHPTDLMREIDAALTPSALSGDAGDEIAELAKRATPTLVSGASVKALMGLLQTGAEHQKPHAKNFIRGDFNAAADAEFIVACIRFATAAREQGA